MRAQHAVGLVVGLVVLVSLVTFIVANLKTPVKVALLFGAGVTTNVFVLMLVTLVLGIVIGWAGPAIWQRSQAQKKD